MLISPDGWGMVGLLICNASSQVKGGGGGGGGGGEGEEEEEEEERARGQDRGFSRFCAICVEETHRGYSGIAVQVITPELIYCTICGRLGVLIRP